MSDLTRLNPTPHAIAVYASQPLSPVATQHSLPSRTLPFTWAGFPPAGSHQLAAGAPIRSPRRRARASRELQLREHVEGAGIVRIGRDRRCALPWGSPRAGAAAAWR